MNTKKPALHVTLPGQPGVATYSFVDDSPARTYHLAIETRGGGHEVILTQRAYSHDDVLTLKSRFTGSTRTSIRIIEANDSGFARWARQLVDRSLAKRDFIRVDECPPELFEQIAGAGDSKIAVEPLFSRCATWKISGRSRNGKPWTIFASVRGGK